MCLIASRSVLAATAFGFLIASTPTDAQSAARATGPHPANTSASLKPPPGAVPRFALDPSWPKALPPTWTWRDTTKPGSDVLGIFADQRDHVWISNRGQIAEYDPAGNIVQILERPTPLVQGPTGGSRTGGFTAIHGMYLDHKGFLWSTARDEHQIIKMTQDGKLVMTI